METQDVGRKKDAKSCRSDEVVINSIAIAVILARDENDTRCRNDTEFAVDSDL